MLLLKSPPPRKPSQLRAQPPAPSTRAPRQVPRGKAVSTGHGEAALSPSGLLPGTAPSPQSWAGGAFRRLLSRSTLWRVSLEALDGAQPPDEAALLARPSPVLSG